MTANRMAARGVALLAVSALLLVTACGSDSSDSSGGSASTSAASSSSGEADSVAKAKAELAKFADWPTSIGVTEPLKTRPEGKLIDYVACAAPLCVQLGKDITEAAAEVGMKVNVVNGGVTPESVTAAFNKVVQDKPDAVIDMNYPLEQWRPQLTALGKMKAKILINNVPQEDPLVTARVFNEHDATLAATQGAMEAIVASNGGKDGDILYINAPDLGPGAKFQADILKKVIAENCSECNYKELDVSAADVGKSLPSQLASYLQANPKVKVVRAYYGDMLSGVPAALKGAGIEGVQVFSGGGSRVNWQYIKDGGQTADWYLYLNVYGYQLVDILARATTGQEFKVPLLPTVWIRKSNVGKFDLAGTPPFGDDYKAQFKKLWASAQ